MRKPYFSLLPLSASILFANAVLAEDSVELQGVYITGGVSELMTQPGSATLIDDVELETFEYTDIHRVLNAVPGINLQEEDGYGLRPNIGMRGTAPERSKKITIMEDGVLSGPAPYSAPAAYYFPNVSRMSAVEVFKGPSAIQYGPATIAGALNLVSRPIPYSREGEVDIQYGERNFQRYNAYYGGQAGKVGYLVEGLNMSTDGFKDLPDDSDTGFERNDFTLKTSYEINGTYNQTLQLKLGYADEDSNETYLGLTRDDFDDDPYQRYAASALDNMSWEHYQFQLTHVIELSHTTKFTTDLYQNTFSRDWFKLNKFGEGSTASVDDVLKNPTGNNLDYYEILTGQRNSTGSFEQLLIGNNGRTYVSQGLQTRMNSEFSVAGIPNELEVGLRLHADHVERDHTEASYNMVNGELVATASPESTTNNKGEAQAIAVYIKDDLTFDKTTLSLGLRAESIETKLTNNLVSDEASSSEMVVLPGAGVYSQVTDSIGLLAGVYKGFTSTSPGQEGDVDPEESLNYEFGVRVQGDHQLELIGFINDYSNFKGTCTGSNSCDTSNIDKESNGGEALVYGLESSYKFEPTYKALSFPLQLTYTYTKSEFQTTFEDSLGVFAGAGDIVNKGDEMAYLPEHRLNARAGVNHMDWSVVLNALYQSEMRDVAGQGSIPEAEKIDAYTVLDLAVSYQVNPSVQVYSTADNLLGTEYMASAQPMGYRPGKPRAIHAGVKVGF